MEKDPIIIGVGDMVLDNNLIDRVKYIADQVAAMKTLWRDDPARHEGPYVRFPDVRLHPKPHQRPHPPVLLGGAAERIFERVVGWAEGWIPGVQSAEDFRTGQARLVETAEAKGRDPDELIQVAFGLPECLRAATELEALRDLGAHHATIWLRERGEAVLTEIEALARERRSLG